MAYTNSATLNECATGSAGVWSHQRLFVIRLVTCPVQYTVRSAGDMPASDGGDRWNEEPTL
jgi:hypothetical protein